MVEEYLRREECFGIPKSQRSLITLVLQKLLSSSTFAIAGTLQTIINRLEDQLAEIYGSKLETVSEHSEAIEDYLTSDYEAMEEYEDEEDEEFDDEEAKREHRLTPEYIPNIKLEINDLKAMYDLAMGIAANTKGECLLKALKIAFKQKNEKGEPEKALIFTESTRTQKYVKQLLEENGYKGKLVLFNGSNTDPESKAIYNSWKQRNEGTNKVSGSLTADKRQALVDYFREDAQIMIATEAAAEGINLQFCSLIVNYDMPWNPQRVEQRIGRCHRYGQKYDVIVVNFINKKNRADERIYQLLNEKFNLFEGVFGSSDEVLGSIGDGVDFEKRILKICQECRTPQEIDRAFDRLQEEMSDEIANTVAETTHDLFKNFDEDVVRKLKVRRESTQESLDEFQNALWRISIDQLGNSISIIDADRHIFELKKCLSPDISLGKYSIGITADGTYNYRLGIPLANWVICQAGESQCDDSQLYEIDYSGYGANISRLAGMKGHRGIIIAKELEFTAQSDKEQRIVFVGFDCTTNEALDDEIIKKIMEPSARLKKNVGRYDDVDGRLSFMIDSQTKLTEEIVRKKNRDFIRIETDRINRWADDQTNAAEQEIKSTKVLIRQKENEARHEVDGMRLIELQEELRKLQQKKRRLRDNLQDLEDEIDEQRKQLIERSIACLTEKITEKTLFSFQWIIK